jgi:hypothetical protein
MSDRRASKFKVVSDAAYPGMYRVRCPDGRLSDMVNLTRANEAARVLNKDAEDASQ